MDDPDSNHDDGEGKEQKDYNNDGNPVMVGGQQQSQQQRHFEYDAISITNRCWALGASG